MSLTERQLALNEANVLKIMDHPNIIRYECNFEIEGNLHLMMEYADAGSLSQYISVNCITPVLAVSLHSVSLQKIVMFIS